MSIEVDIESGKAREAIDKAFRSLDNSSPLMMILAGIMEHDTEANFEAEGQPHWVPLAASTVKERLKRNKGSSVLKILQDRGILAASISSTYGSDFAQIGAGGAASPYAASQQLGVEIQRVPHSSWVRLRTDRKGQLLRQGKNGKLAVFAKDSHKQATTRRYTSEGYTISVPARPYLPFSGPPGGAQLQPSTEEAMLTAVTNYMTANFSG